MARKEGLGRLTAEKAAALKALLERGLPQDKAAWLVAVNGGRANDVEHGRKYAARSPASLAELRALLQANLRQFELLVNAL